MLAFDKGIHVALGRAALSVMTDVVAHGRAHRRRQGSLGCVVEHIAQDGHWYAAQGSIAGHHWVESLDADLEGHLRVLEPHLAKGVGGTEPRLPKPGQAVIEAGHATISLIGRLQHSLQNAHNGRPFSPPGIEREHGLSAVKALGRAIHDLPILEVAPSSEGHGAGPDATQGKRDLSEILFLVPGEYGPLFVAFDAHFLLLLVYL